MAESLGRLFAAYPAEMIVTIDSALTKGDERKKATVAKSVKYTG